MVRGVTCAALAVGLLPAFSGIVSAAVTPYTTDSNTLALWHFDETGSPPTSYADSAGNATRALVPQGTGSLTSVPGLFGSAVSGFAPQIGTDNRLLSPVGAPPNGAFGVIPNPTKQTLEAWVKFGTGAQLPQSQTASTLQMVYRNAGSQVPVEFGFANSGGNSLLRLAVKRNGDTDFTVLTANLGTLSNDIWYHIAYSLEQVGADLAVKLYFQTEATGVATPAPVASQIFTNFTYNTGSYIVRVGESGQSNVDPFTGIIDEMRLSNIARTTFSTFAVPEVASLSMLSASAAGLLLMKPRR